jgi:hypothetical protein
MPPEGDVSVFQLPEPAASFGRRLPTALELALIALSRIRKPSRLVVSGLFTSPNNGDLVARQPNYHQAKKQKEQARKARQQEKQQRRSSRAPGEEDAPPSEVAPSEGSAAEPTSGGRT